MRYPVERWEYNKIVGKTRVENIAEILRELGFAVDTYYVENDDVDIWVFRDGTLVLVVEVLNWRKGVYMDYKRLNSILENFGNDLYCNVGKLLVFSFWNNIENQRTYLEGKGIDFLELGFQTQPVDYYTFFKEEKILAYGMKPDCDETRGILRTKLIAYFEEKDLI
jgi:hypothetical protein